MPTLEDVFLKLCIRDKTSSSFVVNTLTETLKSSFRKRLHGQVRNGVTSTLGRRKTEVSGGLVYPGVTASAEDASIQPISYAQKLPEAELSEFQKIKRRFSLKVTPGNVKVKICNQNKVNFLLSFLPAGPLEGLTDAAFLLPVLSAIAVQGLGSHDEELHQVVEKPWVNRKLGKDTYSI